MARAAGRLDGKQITVAKAEPAQGGVARVSECVGIEAFEDLEANGLHGTAVAQSAAGEAGGQSSQQMKLFPRAAATGTVQGPCKHMPGHGQPDRTGRADQTLRLGQQSAQRRVAWQRGKWFHPPRAMVEAAAGIATELGEVMPMVRQIQDDLVAKEGRMGLGAEQFCTLCGQETGRHCPQRRRRRRRDRRTGGRLAGLARRQVAVVRVVQSARATRLAGAGQIGVHADETPRRFDPSVQPRNPKPPGDFVDAQTRFERVQARHDGVGAQHPGAGGQR